MQKPSPEYIRTTDALVWENLAKGRLTDVWDLLLRTHAAFSDRVCIVEKEHKAIISHTADELYRDVCALRNALYARGINGQHIALLGENSYLWLVAFFGVTCSGNTAVPLDRELTAEELCALARKADCTFAFCAKNYLKSLSGEGLRCVELSRGKGDTLSALLDEGQTLPQSPVLPAADDTAAIIFTSGTTGANKGVRLTHRNLAANADGVARTNEPAYSVLSVLPLNHAYELGSVLPHLYMGSVIYINDRLRNFFANIRAFSPEYIAVVPLFAENIRRMILHDAEENGRLDDLKKRIDECRSLLRQGIDRRETLFAPERESFGYMFPYLACGGAPLKGETAAFLDTLGFRLLLGYGLTETSPIVSLNQNAGRYPTSVGQPFPYTQIRISEPDADGVGEVYVRGDNVSPGYYNDPQADRLSFEDGWFKTGDFGYLGETGELYITGRKKNLIILPNGKNIFPEELEYFFTSTVDGIRDAVVFESAQSTGDEESAVLVLSVTLQDGVDAQSIELIREAVLRRNRELPVYKQVQDVQFSAVPFARTSTKKIIRKKVKEQYESTRDTAENHPKL